MGQNVSTTMCKSEAVFSVSQALDRERLSFNAKSVDHLKSSRRASTETAPQTEDDSSSEYEDAREDDTPTTTRAEPLIEEDETISQSTTPRAPGGAGFSTASEPPTAFACHGDEVPEVGTPGSDLAASPATEAEATGDADDADVKCDSTEEEEANGEVGAGEGSITTPRTDDVADDVEDGAEPVEALEGFTPEASSEAPAGAEDGAPGGIVHNDLPEQTGEVGHETAAGEVSDEAVSTAATEGTEVEEAPVATSAATPGAPAADVIRTQPLPESKSPPPSVNRFVELRHSNTAPKVTIEKNVRPADFVPQGHSQPRAAWQRAVRNSIPNKGSRGGDRSYSNYVLPIPVLTWVREVTGVELPENATTEIEEAQEWLKSGVLLCEVANRIRPGIVPSVERGPFPFAQRQNITNFLAAAARIGVKANELFKVEDLYEGEDMQKVFSCVAALGRVSYELPDYHGPKFSRVLLHAYHIVSGTRPVGLVTDPPPRRRSIPSAFNAWQ